MLREELIWVGLSRDEYTVYKIYGYQYIRKIVFLGHHPMSQKIRVLFLCVANAAR